MVAQTGVVADEPEVVDKDGERAADLVGVEEELDGVLLVVGVLADVDIDVDVDLREVVPRRLVDVEHLCAVDAQEQRRAPLAGRRHLRHEHRDVCGAARDLLLRQRRALREEEVVPAKPQVVRAVRRGRVVGALHIGLVRACAQRLLGCA